MFAIIINYYNAVNKIGINEVVKAFESRNDAQIYYTREASRINGIAELNRSWFQDAII